MTEKRKVTRKIIAQLLDSPVIEETGQRYWSDLDSDGLSGWENYCQFEWRGQVWPREVILKAIKTGISPSETRALLQKEEQAAAEKLAAKEKRAEEVLLGLAQKLTDEEKWAIEKIGRLRAIKILAP